MTTTDVKYIGQTTEPKTGVTFAEYEITYGLPDGIEPKYKPEPIPKRKPQ